MDICTLLTDARNGDKIKRTNAEEQLSKLAEENFSELLRVLSDQIANENQSKENRQLAASIIKNSIIFHDKLQERWLNMSLEQSNGIKMSILGSLASQVKEVRKSVSSTIAGICKIELPLGKWPEIIDVLVNTCMHENLNFRLSSLETLGYICEEISPKGINYADVDKILSAVFNNISSNDFIITQYCLNTLLNVIPLAEKNFLNKVDIILNKNESAIIFKMIFECCNKFITDNKAEDLFYLILQMFIEILVKFYNHIHEFMSKIAEFSFHVFSNCSSERLIILNFEFWITVAEKELDICDTKDYKGYLSTYSNDLLKFIMVNIKKFEEDEDEDNDWNLSKASVSLLSMVAQFSTKEMIENLMNYVKQNLVSSEWRNKSEALLIFGCLLESNYKDDLKLVIKSSLSGLLTLLFDGNMFVRKTSSWVIVRITELYPKIFDKNNLNTFIPVLINALNDKNIVAINVCYAFINLLKNLGDKDTLRNTSKILNKSDPLSQFFETLFKELFSVAYKESSYDRDMNLSMTAFLTLSNLIEFSSHDKQDKFEELILFLMKSLENVVKTNMDHQKILDFQSYIINVIDSLFKKYLKIITPELAIQYYTLLDSTFKLRNTVYDEAISSISSLAINQSKKFDILMDKFLPYLKYSLSKNNETSLLRVAVIATGDISKALESGFSKYANQIIPDLFNILQDNNVSKHIKILVINILGDIAMNIPENFLIYLDSLMNILFSACKLALTIDENDEEESYLESLRLGLVETFTSISFAMKDCQKEKEFAQYVPSIFEFLNNISMNKYNPPNNLLKSIIGFIADMCTTYGKQIKVLIQGNNFIFDSLSKLKSSKSKKNAEFYSWAEEVITMVNSS